MRRSRSLPDSGGHLAQLIMIACLLGTPSLNAIPLPSLSSIPNQNSRIHSIPHLSKRMEIASLGTLAIEAKNARAAPDLVNAEHAAAALQKSSSAKGVNKAGAPGAGVFPLTHTDHPSTLHHLTHEDDSLNTFFHLKPTNEQTIPKDPFPPIEHTNEHIIPIDPSLSSPNHPIKSLKTSSQKQGTEPFKPDLATGNELFDLKHPDPREHSPLPTTDHTLPPGPSHPESPKAPTPDPHQQAIPTSPRDTQKFAPDHANSDVPITPPKAGRAPSFLERLQKTTERLQELSQKKFQDMQRARDELRQLRVKQKIKKSEKLDVKDAAQSPIAQPRNVGSTAKVHPSAKDKKSPPVHESELQSHHFNSKDERENPLGESEKAVIKDKTTFQKSRFQRIFTKDFWSKLTVTKDFWSKLTDLRFWKGLFSFRRSVTLGKGQPFWKGLFRFRKSVARGKAVGPVTANNVA